MLDYQAPRCIGEENLRFEMRPGLTGLAQIKGRNNIWWEERIQYDIEYVKTFSLSLVVSFYSMPLYIRFFSNDEVLGIWYTILSMISWINVSSKVVKIIQSYTGVVDKMVWRKF